MAYVLHNNINRFYHPTVIDNVNVFGIYMNLSLWQNIFIILFQT